jgi:hypothetical protein
VSVPQPRIKRYALVPYGGGRGIRRFHLARVAPSSRSALGADRLERMEEIAERDRGRENGSKPRPDDA